MGQVAGYTVADYLIQHASRERRSTACPPAPGTPSSAISAIPPTPPGSRTAPGGRLLYRYAIPLYRHAADAGDRAAVRPLARLLAERGDLDELRARADAGDAYAAVRLARLLADRGDLDELRARADAGDEFAA